MTKLWAIYRRSQLDARIIGWMNRRGAIVSLDHEGVIYTSRAEAEAELAKLRERQPHNIFTVEEA